MLKNNNKVRVCKLFFKNTRDITDRAIRTVFEKRYKLTDSILESDQRGKHLEHPTIDETTKNEGRKHIESIPRIESHYTIFWSDNCAGQQKNKFMIAVYMYAIQKYDIDSICHNFLIKGHIQNEGDSAHFLIKCQVKRDF